MLFLHKRSRSDYLNLSPFLNWVSILEKKYIHIHCGIFGLILNEIPIPEIKPVFEDDSVGVVRGQPGHHHRVGT